jgi:hypothetical protein
MRRIAVFMIVVVAALMPGTAAAAATGLAVSARSAGLAADPVTVVLAGRYTCGPFPGGIPTGGVVDLTVEQAVDGATVRGFGFLTPSVCDGRWQQFTADVTAFGGLTFVTGSATWTASGYVEGSGDTQTIFVPPTKIRIR